MAHLAQIEAQYCQCFLSVFCKLQSVMRNNYYKSGFYPTSSYVQCIWLGKEYGLPLFCQPLLFPSPCCIDLKQQKLGGGLGMRLYCCSMILLPLNLQYLLWRLHKCICLRVLGGDFRYTKTCWWLFVFLSIFLVFQHMYTLAILLILVW
jgi:hypothetical protein